MHSSLISRYNAVVPEDGICYHLGDVGMTSSEKIKEVISQLNGTNVLILGNHDKGMNAMYKMGFDVVLHGMTMVIANELVTFTHCPLLGLRRERTDLMEKGNVNENWHGELNPKRRRFTTQNFGQFHVHGHIHSPNNGKSEKIYKRQYDTGVDANNYSPVSMGTIESWITKTIREEKIVKEKLLKLELKK